MNKLSVGYFQSRLERRLYPSAVFFLGQKWNIRLIKNNWLKYGWHLGYIITMRRCLDNFESTKHVNNFSISVKTSNN